MIFSDLDGTLLDHDTYDWSPARPALEALAARGVPVILCSSKTRVEMQRLSRAMHLDAPLIVENGGGVWLPGSWPHPLPPGASEVAGGWVVVLGSPVQTLRAALGGIARQLGVSVRGFGDMDVDEVATRTGLPRESANLARQREFSEPFVMEDDVSLTVLDAAAREQGLRVTRGGRFFHLTGPSDKGRAVEEVCTWLGVPCVGDSSGDPVRSDATLGFGDAPNDLPLLRAVREPVIVLRPDGTPHPDLVAALPHARVAPAPGPAGWNAAALDWLSRQPQP